jgi:phosphate transport system substrate-binding protein
VEFVYAFFHHLRVAAIENASGHFVQPDLTSISAAANSAAGENGFGSSIANSPAPAAYPIATFSWLMFKDNLQPDKRQAMLSFIEWMLTAGQKECSALGYAPLPPTLVASELAALRAHK